LLARYRFWFWAILAGDLRPFFLWSGIRLPGTAFGRWRKWQPPRATSVPRTCGNAFFRKDIRSRLASLASTFNQMLDRLEESFERISRFSADIAHDLRTPVNNIRGEAEVALARARSADEYRDVIESCLEEAVRLSDLIGDLLFLARAESPLTHLRRERVDVGELLGGVREYYEASAADNGVSLTTAVADQPVIAELDRTLLQRAVGNLVSNALAHTPSGQWRRQSCWGRDSNQTSSTIHIEVSDTGVGIPAEALPRVFDRFFRVDSSRSQGSGGTGLGAGDRAEH
jgi:two-component system, OmpR family, heavy metal sensor histidine kinase CusS